MRDLSFSTTPILFGVVLYIFTGCASLFPDKDKQIEKSDSLSEEALTQKIEAVDEEISNNDPNADLLYQKGYLLGELAQKRKAPSNRTPLYQNMHDALINAKELFQNSEIPSGTQKVDDLLKVRWSNEHNQGVQIIQTDSALSDKQYQKAIAYFKNATIILPDTTISYRMKGQTHYKHKDLEKAIATLETAHNHIPNLSAQILEQLAFMYLENGQDKEAVAVYEKANSSSEENLNLIHGLSNAYIKFGNHQKAVELLRVLIENEPGNIIYRQTQGTELYFLASEHFERITGSSDSSFVADKLAQIDSLLAEAEVHYRKAHSENPDEQSLTMSLVSFYQNSASKYQRILPLIDEDFSKPVEDKIETYLQQSIPLYKDVLANDPGNEDIRNKLFLTYTYLGMENEAQEFK
ncbi:MAG: tetratricopeptide repeat protein [Balneolaceae bacterium]|nr:tetratricopeptide repeat protein [Balneolaceae bacterium]